MDIVLNPSLSHMCLVRIAVELWKLENVSRFGMEAEAVTNKVEKLPLPNQLKRLLSVLYIPEIGAQTLQWFRYLHTSYAIDRSDATQLRWTPSGTIDSARSVEVLLSDQSLAVGKRFELANDFCFPKPILNALWSQMSGANKRFYEWKETVNFSEREGLSKNQYYFKRALTYHNTVAAKYFYRRLSPKKQRDWFDYLMDGHFHLIPTFSADRQIPPQFCADLLCFLLSKFMDSDDLELLGSEPTNVLPCFLTWPYQQFFLEVTNHTWDYIYKDDFRYLVYSIYGKINHNYDMCPYRNIFVGFWQASPLKRRKYVINHRECVWFMLDRFFDDGEEEICRMVLGDASAAQKDKLINEYTVARYQARALGTLRQNFAFLKFLLAECAPSVERIQQYRTAFDEPSLNLDVNDKIDFFKFLDSFSSIEQKNK